VCFCSSLKCSDNLDIYLLLHYCLSILSTVCLLVFSGDPFGVSNSVPILKCVTSDFTNVYKNKFECV